MPQLATLEEQIKAEYGVIKGWLSTHPYAASVIAFFSGLIVGLILG